MQDSTQVQVLCTVSLYFDRHLFNAINVVIKLFNHHRNACLSIIDRLVTSISTLRCVRPLVVRCFILKAMIER